MSQASIVRGILLCMAFSYAASQAFGADKGGKVVYVDIEKITAKALFVSDLVGDIEKKIDAKQKKLKELGAARAALLQKIEAQGSLLSEASMKGLVEKSLALDDRLEAESIDLNAMLLEIENERIKPALGFILDCIRSIGEEEGYDLILRSGVVLYGRSQLDITEKVIQRLDRDYTSGKIKITKLWKSGAVGATRNTQAGFAPQTTLLLED